MLRALCFVVGYMIFRAQTLSKLSRLVKKKLWSLRQLQVLPWL